MQIKENLLSSFISTSREKWESINVSYKIVFWFSSPLRKPQEKDPHKQINQEKKRLNREFRFVSDMSRDFFKPIFHGTKLVESW